jgi:hypothetical protein
MHSLRSPTAVILLLLHYFLIFHECLLASGNISWEKGSAAGMKLEVVLARGEDTTGYVFAHAGASRDS